MPAKLEEVERKRRALKRTQAWRAKNYWLYKCQRVRAAAKRRKKRIGVEVELVIAESDT